MNSGQLFALFIIGFMAFSTVAFVLSASFDQQPAGNGTQPVTNQPPANKLSFSARVDANVLEVFPSFKLFALTKEFDLAKIDSAIAGIEGVSRISSGFRPGSSGSAANSYYVADVSFDSKKTDFEALSAAIGEKTGNFLSDFGFFPNSLVVVPKKILLENPDLNISKDYELKDSVIQSYLNSGTQKGDEIQLRIEATFAGEQPLSLSAFELSNYSGGVKQHSVSLALPLALLEPKLTFTADANYSDRIGENALKQELSKIADFNSLENFSAETIYYNMRLAINQPFPESLWQDLNSALPAMPGFTDAEFVPDGNSLNAIIGFTEGADIKPLKEAISRKLFDLNVPAQNFSFTEPAATFSGNVILKTTEAKPAAEALKELFASKKFFSKVFQVGRLAASSLADPDTKEQFAVDSNYVEAALFPVHKAGDEIFAVVTFFTERGKIMDAKALEAVNPVRIN